MSDGPRRAGPTDGDDPLAGLFRDDAPIRTPKYVAPPEKGAPDPTPVRPARALPERAFTNQVVDEEAAQKTAIRGIPALPEPSVFVDESPAPVHTEPSGRHHPFTRSLLKTAASTVIPGLGMIRSRARGMGVLLTALFFVGLAAIAVVVIADPVRAAAVVVKPSFLKLAAIAFVAGGLLWVAQIAGTHLVTRPRQRTQSQRMVGALAVGVLSFAIAAPMAVAARYSVQQAGLVNTVFQSESDTKSQTRPSIDTKGNSDDVWAAKPRLNILLVGLDDSSVRQYGNDIVSTDTMMVASIDTANGNTVITQVPRNMARMQFPAASKLAEYYPYGFYDGVSGDNYSFFANAVWSRIPQLHPELFTNTDYPNADALKLGMEGTLGLKIDYFVAINIDGLVDFIDAIGGVRINVNQKIPIASSDQNPVPTGYIEPGPNKLLTGYYAMWYARARHGITGGDYDRMGRQTCVIKAVLDQADPATMLTRYEAIANASEKVVQTDIPQEMLPHMLELARRVKNGKQARVLFVHEQDGFVTYDPDFEMMRQRVQTAIDTVGETTKGAPSTVAPTTPSPGPSSSAEPSETATQPTQQPTQQESTPTPSVAPAESLTDACAYNPLPDEGQ